MDCTELPPDMNGVTIKMEVMEEDGSAPESEHDVGGDADRGRMRMEFSFDNHTENVSVRKYPSEKQVAMDLRKKPPEMDMAIDARRVTSETDLVTNLKKMPTVTVHDVDMRRDSTVQDYSLKKKSSDCEMLTGEATSAMSISSETTKQRYNKNLKSNVTNEFSEMGLNLAVRKKASCDDDDTNARDCDLLGPGSESIKKEPQLETDVDAMRQTNFVSAGPGLRKDQSVMETEASYQQPLSCIKIKTEPDVGCEEPSVMSTEPQSLLETKIKHEPVEVCEVEEPRQTKLIVKLKRKQKAPSQVPKKSKVIKLKLKSGKKSEPVPNSDPDLTVKCEPQSVGSSYSALDCEQVSSSVETSVEENDVIAHQSVRTKVRHMCSHCDQHFCSRSSLKRHYNRKHCTDNLIFPCRECGDMFARLSQLRAHERKHRGGEKTFPCQQCDVIFTRACHLKVHMRKHTGERPFTCDECGSTFRSTSNLNRHKMKHSGHRPYICTVCQANFYQSSHLVSHIRKHTGERPFVCRECQATFTQLTHLHRHMAKHTGKKPHQCSECGQGFVENCALRKHMQKHRPKPVEPLIVKIKKKRTRRRAADVQQQVS